MGEINASMLLRNGDDVALVRMGRLEDDLVRQVEAEGVVDTGARTLALPEDLVKKLGAALTSQVKVTYADDRSEMRAITAPIEITVEGRTGYAEAIVLPAGSEVLIGQIVLERLDLLADCARQRLVINPESPFFPGLSLR